MWLIALPWVSWGSHCHLVILFAKVGMHRPWVPRNSTNHCYPLRLKNSGTLLFTPKWPLFHGCSSPSKRVWNLWNIGNSLHPQLSQCESSQLWRWSQSGFTEECHSKAETNAMSHPQSVRNSNFPLWLACGIYSWPWWKLPKLYQAILWDSAEQGWRRDATVDSLSHKWARCIMSHKILEHQHVSFFLSPNSFS